MTAPAAPASRAYRRRAHLPGLDGLRGVAVLGVLAFHSGWGWASGGFLGVSLFFTLSGFLIARLLLDELDRRGTIDLGRFFARRARRLLPAAFAATGLAILVTLVAGTASQRADINGDVVASVLYVANWRFLLHGDSYTDLFAAASPLQHMWSLAIEEQLYLLVPLVLLGAARVAGRRGVVLVVASTTGLLAVLSIATHASVSVDTSYYGTHVRAVELLVGVGLAAVTATHRPRWSARVNDGVGAGLLVAILAAWMLVPRVDDGLFAGPIIAHAAATAVLIWIAIGGDSVIAPVLGWQPLEWIGRRSYGIYVYHWPLFLYFDQELPGAAAAVTLSAAWATTFALAALSHRYLEQPVRVGDALVRSSVARAGALAASVVLVTAGMATASTADPVTDVHAAAAQLDELTSDDARPATSTTTTSTTLAPAPAEEPATTTTTTVPLVPKRLAVFGDSTAATLGLGLVQWASAEGTFVPVLGSAIPGCSLVAEGSRWDDDTEFPIPAGCAWHDRWRQLVDEHRPEVVVVSTGAMDAMPWSLPGVDGIVDVTDAPVRERLRDEMTAVNEIVSAFGADVVWLTLPGPVIENENSVRIRSLNALIREVAADHPAAHVVDVGGYIDSWSDAVDHERRLDGVHLDEGPARDLAAEFLGPRLLELTADPVEG